MDGASIDGVWLRAGLNFPQKLNDDKEKDWTTCKLIGTRES